MNYAIGIDLGGTNIKAAVASADGEILSHLSHETADDSTSRWANNIKEMIGQIERSMGQEPTWIGIAAPGLAAEDGLSIANMQGRLQGLQGLNWTDFLHASQPVPVLNDAHAALLGEAWKGAARNYSYAVLLTLGTGVGGAILAEGRLFKGCIGRAGHLGHISLNPDGPPDIVGTPGSLEDAIGNSSLEIRSKGRFTSTHQLVEAHLEGDTDATTIWLRSVHSLAAGLTSIINAVDPEVIILGGGIAQAGRALFDPLSDFMKRMEWRPKGHEVKIIPAALGYLAGPLVAIYNALNQKP